MNRSCVTLFLAILIVVAAVTLLAAPPVEAKPLKCPSDQVPVGTTCVDKYENSVWSIPAANTSLIKKVQEGKAVLADLTAGGASQVSPSDSCSPAFPGTFPATGNWTAPLYAASVAGVLPTGCVTWFQAEQACALSGKRLLTNQEWQRAAAGTPDPGLAGDGVTTCNTNTSGPVNTGSTGNCVSNWGARDMVGNVWEWVADWVPPASGFCGSALFSGDENCLAGDTQAAGTGALIRGGNSSSGPNAGVFVVNGFFAPSDASISVGFRCAR